jgi:hypothetical protein
MVLKSQVSVDEMISFYPDQKPLGSYDPRAHGYAAHLILPITSRYSVNNKDLEENSQAQGSGEDMAQSEKPYYHIVWSLTRSHNVEKLAEELTKEFIFVRTLAYAERDAVFHVLLPEILVKADTLYAAVSPQRAILFQKERTAFTRRDAALRKKILALYPNRRLPLFAKEPAFETRDDEDVDTSLR